MSKSWISMSWKMPPERFRYSTGGAPGSRLVTTSISGLADLAGVEALLQRGERRIEAALEADQAGDAARFDRLGAGARAIDATRSTGFSQKIALPAAAARRIRSACVSVDEPITTAPTALSANAASAVATCAPCCAASACAARGVDVDHVPQLHARLAGDVAGVDLADPAGAEQCNFNHRRLRWFASQLSVTRCVAQRFSIHSCAGIVA